MSGLQDPVMKLQFKYLLVLLLFSYVSCGYNSEEIKDNSKSEFNFKIIHPEKSKVSNPPILFLLHGYGSNSEDLLFLKNIIDEDFIIVSVEAPIKLANSNFGWFDIEFENGHVNSIDTITAIECTQNLGIFIDKKVAEVGADTENIFILGFSQGASLALDLYLNSEGEKYSAVILSGMINFSITKRVTNCEKAIFVAHGVSDSVIPISVGRNIKDLFTSCKMVLYKEYMMSHTMIEEELYDLSDWFQSQRK